MKACPNTQQLLSNATHHPTKIKHLQRSSHTATGDTGIAELAWEKQWNVFIPANWFWPRWGQCFSTYSWEENKPVVSNFGKRDEASSLHGISAALSQTTFWSISILTHCNTNTSIALPSVRSWALARGITWTPVLIRPGWQIFAAPHCPWETDVPATPGPKQAAHSKGGGMSKSEYALSCTSLKIFLAPTGFLGRRRVRGSPSHRLWPHRKPFTGAPGPLHTTASHRQAPFFPNCLQVLTTRREPPSWFWAPPQQKQQR